MSTLRRTIRALAPGLLLDIARARKALSNVSKHPWADACSATKRLALDRSRFAILPPALRPLSFVIDVGANQGQWISSLMELLPVQETWIFEPNPEAMRTCQERIGQLPSVKYFDLALGDFDGRGELNVTASSDFASILQPRGAFLKTHYGASAASIVANKHVQIAKLDTLVPESRFVDLLKIDVQGFERAVLSGARRVLRSTRAVLIEVNLQSHYSGDTTFPEIWNQLVGQDFSFWSLSPPYTSGGGEALWADAVFVQNSCSA